ncbi:MAG: acyl-CoA dehydrogenase [Thiofilum sp.]|uniref:acyl-CoA dehydrogenase n=1 Tax=Thiofilum sp. TaxID=2212733 RepID=UPI0025D2D1EA|nr:acyl-CoA dehydrogenase [Thiofilum sp.]MBK8454723.1 acyl-CoA dehydrogenase [Thiofilum sp.]
MTYLANSQDAEFVLRHVVQLDALCEQAGLTEINTDLAVTILDEAGKFATDVLAPLNWFGDQNPPTLGEQGVQETAGFKEAYQQFAEAGWLSLGAAEEFGGQALPNVIGTAVNEIWQAANMSYALCPMLSQGAMESIGHHASHELQSIYLPRMASGEWTGTMNLTEPDAGSDLAAVKTKAVPNGDHYLLSGQKIFITWGDHQMTDNIVHLVLARLPDAPVGVKGISLFIVPKYLVNSDGSLGERNSASCLSLEHKLGIHASPTCVMLFDNAVGYLVGEANKGLPYMFTMMNHARQAVGLQGLSISERAYQLARQYAKDRLQGTRRDGSRIPIIEHADVRRMLMTMKSGIEAMRALAFTAAAEVDRARYESDSAKAAIHTARVELYTPIVKGWLTELSQELTYLGVQIHGGMGFIEETGAAQHYRDARILTIYEGTTGIQAADLIGRKTLADRGEGLGLLLAEMAELEASAYPNFAAALAAGQEARDFILNNVASDSQLAGSASVNLMMLMGYLCGGWLLIKGAQAAQTLLAQGEGDPTYLNAKLVTTQFYCEHLLPRALSHLSALKAGSQSIMALSVEQF